MEAPILTMEVSFMPITFIAIRRKTIPIEAIVPMIGEALNGSQK